VKDLPAQQLDYAPPLAWHRRRGVRRWVVLGLIALVGVWCGPGLWHHARVLWWQRYCLNYSAPVGQVVYDDGPGAGDLLGQGGMTHPNVAWSSRATVAARQVACWDRLRELIDRSDPLRGRSGILYLHEGRDAQGKRQLVVVALDWRSSEQLSFSAWTPEPATPLSTLSYRSSGFHYSLPFDAGDKPLRFYAGQPDPHDPSRFTIRYELDGQPGTIEGSIDEGSVWLDVVDGPAKRK
jgi:hypothetical protein